MSSSTFRFSSSINITILLLAFGFLIKLIIIDYGAPHIFHPDEVFIYSRPLKLLLLYSNFQFSETATIYIWLQNVWYGVQFAIGLVFGWWSNSTEFINAILIQDWKIIYCQRFLSILLATIGDYFLIRLATLIIRDQRQLLFYGLLIVLNPIVLISVGWIKYEGISYLMGCFLVYMATKRFYLNTSRTPKKWLYSFSVIALAVRIEFVSFLIAFLIYDLYIYRNEFFDRLKSLFWPIMWGIILFFCITLWPVVYVYNILNPDSASIGKFGNYRDVIFEKINQNIHSIDFFSSLGQTSWYYLKLALIVFFPLMLGIAFYKKLARHMYLFLPFFILLSAIVINNHMAVHYFILPSMLMIVMFIFLIGQLKQKLGQTILVFFSVYFVSISCQFAYITGFSEDHKTKAANYIIKCTESDDLIAIENYGMNGFHPPIVECPEVLKEKQYAVQEIGGGTAKSLEAKSKMAQANCRRIIDIFGIDYFEGSSIEKKWVLTLDDSLILAARKPSYIVLNSRMEKRSKGFTEIQDHYDHDSTFEYKIRDPRLKFLLQRSSYFANPQHIYIRKK